MRPPSNPRLLEGSVYNRRAGPELRIQFLTRARSEAFDLAVCDLDAPGLRAPGFIPALQSEQPPLARKLLFLNADEGDEIAFDGKALAKPFELDRMEGAAAVVLNLGRRRSGASPLQS